MKDYVGELIRLKEAKVALLAHWMSQRYNLSYKLTEKITSELYETDLSEGRAPKILEIVNKYGIIYNDNRLVARWLEANYLNIELASSINEGEDDEDL